MAIEMVRIPSETPNISNTDDFVGLRYAYGNQNGYVIGKGQECSYTISDSKFRINSGRLVLQGVECDIDANGVEITIDNVATKQYYTVYLQVNLATNETKILAMSDTTSYPAIESGDDLTQNTTGTARMKLYYFDVTSGIIGNVVQVVPRIINYGGEVLYGINYKSTINGFRYNIPFGQWAEIPIDTSKIDKWYNLKIDLTDAHLYKSLSGGEEDYIQMIGYVIETIEVPFVNNSYCARTLTYTGVNNSNINNLKPENYITTIITKIQNGHLYIQQFKPETQIGGLLLAVIGIKVV